MGRFLEVPSYYMVPDGKGHWASRDRLVFYSKKLDLTIYVPAGAINDLASIPWFFRRIFPINGPSRPAAALHDYLYEMGGNIVGKHLSREECDDLFLEAMLCSKIDFWNAYPKFVQDYLSSIGFKEVFNSTKSLVSKTTSTLMYKGVRLGGWASFNKKDS